MGRARRGGFLVANRKTILGGANIGRTQEMVKGGVFNLGVLGQMGWWFQGMLVTIVAIFPSRTPLPMVDERMQAPEHGSGDIP